MNAASTGANRCWQAPPKRLFHFASSRGEDETVPNLPTLMSTLQAHHTLIWHRIDIGTWAAAPLESIIPAGYWQVRWISLWNGASLDNVCPRYCLYVAFIVCVDVKIISFQSAAWTFIIRYEANTPANIVIWDILSIYNILSCCGSRE